MNKQPKYPNLAASMAMKNIDAIDISNILGIRAADAQRILDGDALFMAEDAFTVANYVAPGQSLNWLYKTNMPTQKDNKSATDEPADEALIHALRELSTAYELIDYYKTDLKRLKTENKTLQDANTLMLSELKTILQHIEKQNAVKHESATARCAKCGNEPCLVSQDISKAPGNATNIARGKTKEI